MRNLQIYLVFLGCCDYLWIDFAVGYNDKLSFVSVALTLFSYATLASAFSVCLACKHYILFCFSLSKRRKVLFECMQASFVAFVEVKNTGARPFKWLMFEFLVMIGMLCPWRCVIMPCHLTFWNKCNFLVQKQCQILCEGYRVSLFKHGLLLVLCNCIFLMCGITSEMSVFYYVSVGITPCQDCTASFCRKLCVSRDRLLLGEFTGFLRFYSYLSWPFLGRT